MKNIYIALILILLSSGLLAKPDIRVEAETGIAVPGYNSARIPNSGLSDRFSLSNELNLKSALNTRLTIHYRPASHHQISVLAAPLTLKGSGEFDRQIDYMGEHFFAGEPIDASYRFDSYRLEYRYIFDKPVWGFVRSVGAAGKIRDAEIKLETTGNKMATKTNTGFVPLLNMNLGYRYSHDLDFVLEAEGLASPYGRAEDVFAGAVYNVHDKLDVKAGYRLLEGGSDIDEVYTFAAVHYGVIGFVVRFW